MSKRKTLKLVILIIKIVVSVCLLFYLTQIVTKNQSIWLSLQNADVKWLSFSALLMVPNILLQGYKWYLLVIRISSKTSFWEALCSTIGGLSLGILTPGRIGEIAKGLFISHVEKLKITGLALLDRVFNMIVISILGFFASVWLMDNSFHLPLLLYLPPFLFILLIIMLLLYIVLHPRLLNNFYKVYAKTNKLKKLTSKLFSSVKYLEKRTMFSVFFVSCCYQILVAIQFYFAIKGFDCHLLFFDGVIAAFATAFTKAVLPIGIADIGVRETAANMFFGFFLDNEVAIFNGSLYLFFVNVVFPSICGLLMLPKLSFQKDLP